MATTATAGKPLTSDEAVAPRRYSRVRGSLRPRLGVRSRQIALITLLVTLVVMVTTVANISYITRVIVNRTEEHTNQLSRQILYALEQDLAHNIAVDQLSDPYVALARENSGVRELLDSTIAASRGNPIIYLYLTDGAGQIVSDRAGRHELSANRYMIGDGASSRPELSSLAGENSYLQLVRLFMGPPIYEVRSEFRTPLTDEDSLHVRLHIGVSSSNVRRELRSPIETNVFIGLLAIVGAAVVAISSANLLLKPLEAISTSIDRLETGDPEQVLVSARLPQDEMVSGVAARLRQLGERLAGERSELEIMRGRLRQVISHLEDRLLLINREGRVILASPDAEKLLGARDAEIAGLPIDESLGRNHPVVQLVESALSERRSIVRATLHLPHGERLRQILASVQYIEDGGEPVGALVSLRDFESFQKFESQWDLSKRLADLGRITSGIAHEVKNPLNAMVIHLEILRSKLESPTADPRPQIEILDSEIKRLDRVVQTFLNFTRPVEVNLEPLDVNETVKQVVRLAATEARGRGVSIALDASDVPLMVKGDADLLKQALINVIINGCQAMPNGGPLKVATASRDDGTARITINDHGVGIAPDARDRIFNLYYTTKGGGSGIGLAQAFRAIQLHNGQIRFESQVGAGTTFEIILPLSS